MSSVVIIDKDKTNTVTGPTPTIDVETSAPAPSVDVNTDQNVVDTTAAQAQVDATVQESTVEVVGSIGSPTGGLALEETYQSDGPIGSGRAVILSGINIVSLFDPSNFAHVQSYIGVTKNAVSGIGDDIVVVLSGRLVVAGGTFTPGASIFAGSLGVLSETPPATGVVQPVGVAGQSNILYIDRKWGIIQA